LSCCSISKTCESYDAEHLGGALPQNQVSPTQLDQRLTAALWGPVALLQLAMGTAVEESQEGPEEEEEEGG